MEIFTSTARSFYVYFKVVLISHGTHLNINEANKPNYIKYRVNSTAILIQRLFDNTI
jgi:hypothetical protein